VGVRFAVNEVNRDHTVNSAHKTKTDYRLYLVTDRDCLANRDLYESIEQAIRGGVTLIQLREKLVSSREFLDIAFAVKEITSRYQIPLIINDRLDIALAIEADGLHIGQDDLPLTVVRKLFGKDKIIGVSASTLDEAILAEQQGADYLGVGAMYATPTKLDAKTVSLEQLAVIKRSVSIPVVAIGGINETNVRDIMATGIEGVSVVSAILAKQDVQKAAKDLLERIKGKFAD